MAERKVKHQRVQTKVDLERASDFPDGKRNKPGLSREKPGLLSNRFQLLSSIGDGVKQTCLQQMVTTQLAVPEPVLLWQERPLELNIVEGTEPMPEHNKLELSVHRLVHKPERTLLERHNLASSVHMQGHRLLREQHSLV